MPRSSACCWITEPPNLRILGDSNPQLTESPDIRQMLARTDSTEAKVPWKDQW